MTSQQPRLQSNTPIVLAIFGLLFALPGLLYGGVKQAIQDTAINFSQQAVGVDLSFLGIGDIPFYAGILSAVGAFLCGILYKKNPRLLGGLTIGLSLVAFWFLPSLLFLGLISTAFFLIAGIIAFQQPTVLKSTN